MVNELLPLIAIGAVIFGVFLSIAKGYNGSGEPFKFGRLASSLIIGAMGTLSVSMLVIGSLQSQLGDMGYVAFAYLFITQGFATDQGLSRLDK